MELKTQAEKIFLKENLLVFFFSMAVLAGPALSILFAYDLSQFTDCKTYLGLADFNFDQSAVRRYRVIIPFTAAGINYLFGSFFAKLSPTYFQGDFGIPFSFFLINLTLMSCFGALVYRYCRSYNLSRINSMIGLMVVLSSRYTIYFAALPLVDSLFCVIVMFFLLGVRTKNTAMIVTCIFLGPFVKEQFIFIAPLIFCFSHLNKGRMVLFFILSAGFVLSFRIIYDHYFPPTVIDWLHADLYHLLAMKKKLQLLFSFYGIYKILVGIGLWLLLPFAAAVFTNGFKNQVKQTFEKTQVYYLLMVLLQMLLSDSIERMFYLALPIFALLCALASARLQPLLSNKENRLQ